MQAYLDIAYNAFVGYWNWLVSLLYTPAWDNYLYWLIALSVFVWGLEILVPWRKGQARFRRDFWMDAFYMFFNFFLFSLIFHNALSMVGVELFNDFLALFGWTNIIAISVDHLPVWLQMIILVILMDLVQWSTHVMLHRYKFFWNFHKVHHSVKEMGFAAHLRYHWMENIFYKTNKFIAISIVGFGIQEAFYVHIVALAIGHLNHANLNLDYGPLKYILNNPKMHIWHHAKEMPEKHPYGMNFGISLSIWDYIFGTAYVPSSGRDIELGFPNDEKFPQDFAGQIIYPLNKKDE